MRAKYVKIILVVVCLIGLGVPVMAQDFYEQTFSLYGYVVNFFNANLYADDWKVSDSDYGNILYSRLKGDWNPGDNLSFHAELAYNAAIGNQNLWVVYEGFGISPLDGPATGTEADPEIETQADYPTEDFVQSISVEHLWGSLNFGRFDVQFGKLPIAWGTGYFFNPTSRVAAAPFMDSVTEETLGTFAVVPSVSFLDGMLSLQGYVAFQDKSHKPTALQADGYWANLPLGLKFQGIVGSFDLSASWIREVALTLTEGYRRIHYIGIDMVGAVWDFGVYGEAALKYWNEAETELSFESEDISDLLEVCVGFDYFISGLEIDSRVEYYHQGPGVKNSGAYDVSKLLFGEQMVLAEDYLLLYLERSFFDYFKVGGVGVVNLNDASFAFIPEISGEPYGNLEVGLGAMLFYGSSGSEYNGELGEFDITEPAVFLRCKLSF